MSKKTNPLSGKEPLRENLRGLFQKSGRHSKELMAESLRGSREQGRQKWKAEQAKKSTEDFRR